MWPGHGSAITSSASTQAVNMQPWPSQFPTGRDARRPGERVRGSPCLQGSLAALLTRGGILAVAAVGGCWWRLSAASECVALSCQHCLIDLLECGACCVGKATKPPAGLCLLSWCSCPVAEKRGGTWCSAGVTRMCRGAASPYNAAECSGLWQCSGL